MADDDPTVAALRARLDAGGTFRLHEVATLAGVGRTTLNDWLRVGRVRLPHTKTLGGQRRFKAEGVRALLTQLAEVHDEGRAAGPDVPAG